MCAHYMSKVMQNPSLYNIFTHKTTSTPNVTVTVEIGKSNRLHFDPYLLNFCA